MHPSNASPGTAPDLATRDAIAQALRALRNAVAVSVGDEHAAACVDSLAGAVEVGVPEAFASYARWAGRMLAARGIERGAVADDLRRIGQHVHRALASHLAEPLDPFLRAGIRSLEGPFDVPVAPRRPALLPDEMRSAFRDALLAANRRAATDVALDALARGYRRGDVYVDLFERALHEIGVLWERNHVSVAQEHAAGAVAQYALTVLASRAAVPAATRGRAIVTAVEGEMHDLGARMVADVLELDGWSVCFLGADVPTRDVTWLLDAQPCDAIGISATTLARAPEVAQLVRAIQERTPLARPRIVTGGGLFRTAPAFAGELGVDACAADVREAPFLFRRP